MKFHRNQKYFKWGLTAFLVIVASAVFWMIFSNLRGFYDLFLEFTDIIAPILYGCVFAYLMNPIMKRVVAWSEKMLAKRTKWEERKRHRFSVTLGVVASLLVLLLAIYALAAMIIPNLISSVEELLQKERLEGYYRTINGWFSKVFAKTELGKLIYENLDAVLHKITEMLQSIDIGALIDSLTSSVYSVVMGVFNMFVGIVAAVYLLIYKRQLCSQAKKIVISTFNTRHANRLLEIARRTNRIFSGYVIGKILDALFVGVVTYIALLIMGMPYAPLISVMVGVTNIIPFFGPFIGAVPSALLLLIERPIDALYFIIFTLILQMIDGNIIENRILGEKLGISDFWVLVSILVFGGIFGFSGMLLGVPIFAVLYTLIVDVVNDRLVKRKYPTDSDCYYALQNVEELPTEAEQSCSYAAAQPDYDLGQEPEEEIEESDDEDAEF